MPPIELKEVTRVYCEELSGLKEGDEVMYQSIIRETAARFGFV